MHHPKLASENIEITFGDHPLRVERIVNRVTGTTLSAGGEQTLLLRLPRRLSDPIFLTEVASVEAGVGAVQFVAEDVSGRYRARCRIEAVPEGLQFSLETEAPEPVWMVEWKLYGLELREVIVPALGGQMLTREMPEDKQLSYKYPFWWNAQFAIGAAGEEAGLWLRTMQVAPGFKVLRVHKVEEKEDLFALGLGFEADAPLTSGTLAAAWYLDGYAGGWRQPVDVHRRWLEARFGLVPYREHPHCPAWVDDINFVLEIWGMRKDRGRPAHMFADMIRRIEAFAALHPPAQTLLYLPGFAERGIDANAPDYNPSPQLGGNASFKELVRTAHRLGYRVMVHTNVLAMTYTHPRYEAFKPHQVTDPFDRLQGWGLDMDGDWLPEPYFAYINPGTEAWGDLMGSVIGDLLAAYELDAVFLDQTLLAFNTSRGPNFIEGMRRHIRRLQQAFPQVLFAGEGLHEQVLPVLPVAQIHGIDSIADIHGQEGRQPWRKVHPVSTYLFGRYTKFVAHLLTKHPSSSLFRRQEAAYAELGVVPALVLYRPSHALDGPEVQQMLARAKALHEREDVKVRE